MADIALVIDPDDSSLVLHNTTGYRLLGFDAPVPETDSQWAYSADTEGERRANLRYRNRTITASVLVERATAALLETDENTLGQKIGKLAREGGELRFTYPTGTTITFNVLEASFYRTFDIADMAHRRARYEITFVCEPFGLGPEEDLGDNTETTLPALVFTEALIKGDVPALGRLVVDNDDGSQAYGTLITAAQSRYYDSDADAALFYQCEALSDAFGGGAVAGPAGASGSGSNVFRYVNVGTTVGLPAMYLGASGTPRHVGSFRVFARVQLPATNAGIVSLRIIWSAYSGAPFITNPWVDVVKNDGTTAIEGVWAWVDLGLVAPSLAVAGTQRWQCGFQAQSTSANDDVDWDCVAVVPTSEAYAHIFDELNPSFGTSGYANKIGAADSIHWRHDGAFKQDGSLYREAALVGDCLLVPPAGAEGRTVRVFAMFTGSRLVTAQDYGSGVYPSPAITDLSANLFVQPRFLVVPDA